MKDTNLLLEVNHLSTAFRFEGSEMRVLNDVSFYINQGEILGIVGESGSGKSVTVKTIMQLIPKTSGRVLEGTIHFEGENLLELSDAKMQKVRGDKISMIFQEPMTSLNPVFTCGDQIIEAIRLHRKCTKKEAHQIAVEMLEKVGVQMAETRMSSYPHELSGGLRQRIMIAMALCCKPRLLIADEPTTALDPTIQAQIIELIRDLHKTDNMAVLYITHDLGVVAELCQRVVVMYAGEIVEVASVKELFKNPKHPYTMGLMKAMPTLHEESERLYTITGRVPHFSEMPSGCHFGPRCAHCTEKCKTEHPVLQKIGEDHYAACHCCTPAGEEGNPVG